MSKNTTCFFHCDCNSEGIMFSSDDEFPFDIYMNFWSHGKFINNRFTLKDRLRWCFRILIHGLPYEDGVILKPDEAERFAEELLVRAKRSKSALNRHEFGTPTKLEPIIDGIGLGANDP